MTSANHVVQQQLSPAYHELFPVDRGAAFAMRRDLGPVGMVGDGVYCLTRRPDMLAVLRNPWMFPPAGTSPVTGLPITKDQHDLFVRLLDTAATASMLPSLRQRAADIIDGVAARAGCDGISEVAWPFVLAVFWDMCGLRHADARIDTDPLELHLRAGLIATRRHDPGADVISQITQEAPHLPDEEIQSMVVSGIWPSIVFLMTPIGAALLELARRPELCDRLRGNSRDQLVFVNEVLRLEGGGVAGRRTAEPVTLAGVPIPAGATLLLEMGYINRDDSDEMSSNELRMDGRHCHYAFGVGPRRCPAGHFVRSLLVAFIDEWLCRIPVFDVEPGYVPRLRYPDRYLGSGDLKQVLRELPLRWSS